MNLEELLSHNDFIQSLARSLVVDEHKAADITQETWTAALTHPPSKEKPLRAWLTRVVRNVACMMYRDEAKRNDFSKSAVQQREYQTMSKVPSSHEMAAKLETRRNLIEAVLELDEPYRSAIMLRFYENLPPREIAKRLDLPPETVRTRVKRGIGHLKTILDKRYEGGRQAWCLSMLPLAGLSLKGKASGAALATGSAIGGIALGSKIILGIATALIIIFSFFMWHLIAPETDKEIPISIVEYIENNEDPVVIASIEPEEKESERVLLDDSIKPNNLLRDEEIDFSSPPKPKDSSLVRLTGTITVIDENELEHPYEDGIFKLWKAVDEPILGGKSWTSAAKWGGRVQVINGTWSVDVPPNILLHIDNIQLGGNWAVLEGEDEFNIPPNTISLKARWPVIPSAILHVVDIYTGKELDDVELITGKEQIIFDHPYGEKYNVIFESTQSPIELKDTISMREFIQQRKFGDYCTKDYFARSPGYAWMKVEIPFLSNSEYILNLKPGGSVEIEIMDYEEGKNVTLDISRKDTGKTLLNFDIKKNDVIVIDSIPEGTYQISAELGRFHSNPIILSVSEFEIKAGERSYVTLILKQIKSIDEEPLKSNKAAFKGILILPPEWAIASPWLYFRLLDQPRGISDELFILSGDNVKPVDGEEGMFEWDAGLIQPGWYKVSVEGIGFTTFLELNDLGTTNTIIEVPIPGKVLVSVVDIETGLDVDVNTINWQALVKYRTGTSIYSAYRNSETGLFEITAPVNRPIYVSIPQDCMYLSCDPRKDILMIKPDINMHTIKVKKAGDLLILLKDGDRLVPVSVDWEKELNYIDRERLHPYLVGGERGGLHYYPLFPGTYRFKMQKVEGYHPIPEQEVIVNSGECTEHVIQLDRE